MTRAAGGEREREHGGRWAPASALAERTAPSSQASKSGKAAHSSLASSASGEPRRPRSTRGRSSQFHSDGETEQRGQHDAARPDVVDRFGLDRVEGEEGGGDQGGALGQQAAQALPGQQRPRPGAARD